MKQYYKVIDGQNVFAGSSIVLNNLRIFNPTEEQLVQAGYQEWIEPESVPYVPTLQDAINTKISDILQYDSSESVNSFNINGQSGWIDRNTRVALLHALDVVEQNGGTTYTVWFNEMPLTLPVSVIKNFLNNLELYAIEALNVTNRHILEVKQLQTIEEVEAYDITVGYPQILDIILN